jgi:hypothetical protein
MVDLNPYAATTMGLGTAIVTEERDNGEIRWHQAGHTR